MSSRGLAEARRRWDSIFGGLLFMLWFKGDLLIFENFFDLLYSFFHFAMEYRGELVITQKACISK